MTFKYAVILPATGPNKLTRFKSWASQHTPEVAYSLPPQVPIEATALTVRVRSIEDRDLVKSRFPQTLP